MKTRRGTATPDEIHEPVRWGVLGAANIAVGKVIPAMQHSTHMHVVAIASRDLRKAETAAKKLGIPRAYGSYEELLADADVEAVYNPLPNQLHVPWSIKAAEAGKHVLCEKPIALSAAEVDQLIAARDKTGEFVTLLVSVLKLLESFESVVIQGRRPDLRRDRRCGRMRTARNTIVIT